MKIVLDSLLKEWNLVRQSLKERLSALDFNTCADKILFKRECMYTIMRIWCIGRNAKKLNPAAKFIPWFDKYELGEHDDDDDVDNIIEELVYVYRINIFITLHMYENII